MHQHSVPIENKPKSVQASTRAVNTNKISLPRRQTASNVHHIYPQALTPQEINWDHINFMQNRPSIVTKSRRNISQYVQSQPENCFSDCPRSQLSAGNGDQQPYKSVVFDSDHASQAQLHTQVIAPSPVVQAPTSAAQANEMIALATFGSNMLNQSVDIETSINISKQQVVLDESLNNGCNTVK